MDKPCSTPENPNQPHPGGSTPGGLFYIPPSAEYRALVWYGAADGSILTPGFDIVDIQKRIVVLKSFKLIPYAAVNMVDLYLTDGTTVNKETIPANARIDRLFDVYGGGTTIECKINNTPVSVFSNNSGTGYFPADLWLDNIMYKYPERISTWDIKVTMGVVTDIESYADGNPNVKVLVECYLL